MHRPTKDALEFHRIQQELASLSSCKLGKELALNIQPQPTLDQVLRIQAETTEAKRLLLSGRSIPFGGIQDIRQPVERAANGGHLTPEQLMMVAETIYGCRTLHRYLTEQAAVAPRISRYAVHFGRFDSIEEEIRRCIERGSVASRASRALRDIRNEISTLEGRIQERLQSLLRQYRTHLQEALITTRNGRYVLPVKASAKSAVPGSTQGASASGGTLFVEPEAVRHLCEELETWRAMERAEVELILTTLSGLVADQAERLIATLGAVAELDLIFARARLSQAWGAAPATWNDQGVIDLRGARHPLLGTGAIGNRIRLNPAARMLIVTGPNTGGKTLLLKTLGLILLIAQSGLHIPADEGSTLCFFDQLFADIGDSQSLEQSLSTFSGHITNVMPMLAQATPRTLILLDELGSGTDPHEGTALGIALLEAFLAKGAYTLATTHLREIKEFGRLTQGCAIAGMGFDGESLQPTYRLLYGTLGESQGLAIAARAGLPAQVVERARALLHGGAPSAQASAPILDARSVALPQEESREEAVPQPQSQGEAVLLSQLQSYEGDGRETGWEVPSLSGASAISEELAEPVSAHRAPQPPLPKARQTTGVHHSKSLRTPAHHTPDQTPAHQPPPQRLHRHKTQHHQPQPHPALGPHEALLLAPLSPRRVRIWNQAQVREVPVSDSVRRQHPEGLLPGDQLLLREGQVVALRPRLTRVACRNADTGLETPVAANLTQLVILLSACKPDFHAGVLARHLLFAEKHGLERLICLSRADLVSKGEIERWLSPFREVGIQAVALNLLRPKEIDGIEALLQPGLTGLIAHPGAGKSTLLAAICQEGGSSQSDDRKEAQGWPPRARALQRGSGGWLLDLPSLRELGIWKPDLSAGLHAFQPHAAACAQPGCLHRHERGCGVREAVATGQVAERQYQRYRLLLKAMGFGD